MEIEDKILNSLNHGDDGIYWYKFTNEEQGDEVKLRSSVADVEYDDYLAAISIHHSIPVMDHEVDYFIKQIPQNGSVIDVGGCWGWHWRGIQGKRPDLKIYIVDFIKANLLHAKKFLEEDIDKNIYLIHGDATDLIFCDCLFDGVWTVQTFQHIPQFNLAVNEAWRVLKPSGVFANYSFNDQLLIKLIYRMFRREYMVQGHVPDKFYLARASKKQFEYVKEVFGAEKTYRRYTEILFKRELGISVAGKEDSLLGKIDCYLSNNIGIFSTIARQQSFHAIK